MGDARTTRAGFVVVAGFLAACPVDNEGCDTDVEDLDFGATYPRGEFDAFLGEDDQLSDAECFEACLPSAVVVSEELSCDATWLHRSQGGQLVVIVECEVSGFEMCG